MSQTKWLKERNLRAAMLGRGNVAGRNDFIRLNYSCWNEDMDYIKKHYDLVEAGSEAMLWVLQRRQRDGQWRRFRAMRRKMAGVSGWQ